MRLSMEEKNAASTAVIIGDTFKRGNVLLFPLFPGEYCVQKMDGPVTDKNRVITRSWAKALSCFEQFLGEG